MTWILNIESSTNKGSLALTKDGQNQEVIWSTEEESFSQTITTNINKVLTNHKLKITDLQGIGVSMGPGSYTSLRIGFSVAKGICYGLGIPLIGIPTLKLIALKAIKINNAIDANYISLIDARRMDAYAAIYEFNSEIILPASFVTLNEDWFEQWTGKTCIIGGDGSSKLESLYLDRKNIHRLNIIQSAEIMDEISYNYFQTGNFEDLAYSTPNYLKPPNITTAKHIKE